MATRRDLPGKRVQIETGAYTPSVGQVFVTEARRRLAESHERIKHCVNQLNDAQLWWRANESMNSVANLMLHVRGNLRQWIVSGVTGAADERNRPQEFAERGPLPREALLRQLDVVVAEADEALMRLDDDRLVETRRIQGFSGPVLGAILDSLTHLSGHVQEIIHITRLQLRDAYRFAWTPTTPEQAAIKPKEGETVEVRDAIFGEMSGHPLLSEAPQPGLVEIPGAVPPMNDYLLALEQEFQEEEEKGKL